MPNKTEVPEIKQAVVFLHEMSADEKVKESVRRREIAIRDQASAIDYATEVAEKRGREEGREEGIEIGKNKRDIELAASFRAMGVSEEVIKQAIENAGK